MERFNAAIKFREGPFEHEAMTGIPGGGELLHNTGARQAKAFQLLFLYNLGGSKTLLMRCLVPRGFGLLIFNGFTLPTARHCRQNYTTVTK